MNILTSKRSIFHIFLLLLIIVLNLGNLVSPIGKDQGIFGYIGQRIAAGELPYRDVWDHKPPAIFYTYAAVEKVFPDSLIAQRIASIFASFLSAILLFLLARLFFKEEQARITSMIFAFFLNCRTLSEGGALTETYMVIFTIAAYYFAARLFFDKKPHMSAALCSGVMLGVAFMFKPVAAVSLIAIGIFLLYLLLTRKVQIAAFLYNSVFLVSGFLLPNVLIALWFAQKGILQDYINCAFLYNAQYIQNNAASLPYILNNLKDAVFIQGIGSAVLWLGAVLGLIYFFTNKKRTPPKIFFVVLLVFETIGTSAGMRFYGHYFLQMVPTATLLFATWLFRPTQTVKKKTDSLIQNGVIVLALIAFCAQLYFEGRALYRYGFQHQRSIQQNVAQYLKSNVSRDQIIYVPGMETPVYYLTHTKAPTRYVHDDFLYKMTLAKKNSVIEQIINSKPGYIIVFDQNYLTPLGRLSTVIESSYHLEKMIDTVKVYKRS